MKYNFKKKYGQNFLTNDIIPKRISSSFIPNKNDLIIEIGLGTGVLTKELINKSSFYLGYEIDTETKPYLSKILDLNNVIFDDFLNRDVKQDISNINFENLYVVGNLPYYITTPILTKILESNLGEKEIIIMVQDEVAKRLSSKPNSKEYGFITVLLNAYYDIEYLFKVNKNNFIPIPKVDSAVIKLKRKSELNNYEYLSSFLKDAFKYKRKTLKNNLYNYDLEKINTILIKYNLSIHSRAEQVPVEVYLDIINHLY